VTILQDARAKAAELVQQQEAQGKQAAEAAKQQVGIWQAQWLCHAQCASS
jgi:hypothetical protein